MDGAGVHIFRDFFILEKKERENPRLRFALVLSPRGGRELERGHKLSWDDELGFRI
jgi:hypothetical protein